MNRNPLVRTSEDNIDKVKSETAPRISEFRRFGRVFLGRGVVLFGMTVLGVFILVALFAPLLAPYDPYEPSLGQGLLGPSREHLLGTDALGRDTLSRIIYGSRTSLMIGLIVVFAAAVIGWCRHRG